MRSEQFNTEDSDYANDNDAVEYINKYFQVESGLNYSILKTVIMIMTISMIMVQ